MLSAGPGVNDDVNTLALTGTVTVMMTVTVTVMMTLQYKTITIACPRKNEPWSTV